MIVYPAMDLMDGRCVRLSQGKFDQQTVYELEPVAALAAFAAEGAEWAHVVDLDGARAGAPRQHDLIAGLAGSAPLKLQVAGGIRTRDQAAYLLDSGAGRIVVGSLTVKQPELVDDLLAEFGPDKITLALDVHMVEGSPQVAIHGWAEGSGFSLFDITDRFPSARHLLVTDIGRDGMLTGPNVDLVAQCVKLLPDWHVQASGGVSSLQDLTDCAGVGASGAIVGKALWEGRFTVAEAIDHAVA